MAVIYWDSNDVPHADTVNIEAGTPADTSGPRISDDEASEGWLRQNYPLLCARFLDGYTEAQVARGEMTTIAEVRVRIARELRKAGQDPATKAGPGHALVTMSGGRQ